MFSLFVFFVHGGTTTFKIAMRPILNKKSALVIGVNNINGHIRISGSAAVLNLLTNKEQWFVPNPEDPLALFKQLFDKVKNQSRIDPDKICFYSEGNYGVLAGSVLELLVVELINFTSPRYALLPTGTHECCRFINYWSDFYHYKQFDLQQAFIDAENYYSPAALEQKSIELQPLIQVRALTCPSPLIATFNKELSPFVLEDVYAAMYSIASPRSVSSNPILLENEAQKVEEESTFLERDLVNDCVSDSPETSQRQTEYFARDPSKEIDAIPTDSNFFTLGTEPVTPMELSSERVAVDLQNNKTLHFSQGLTSIAEQQEVGTILRHGKSSPFTHAGEPTRSLQDAISAQRLSLKPAPMKKKKSSWGIFSCCKDTSVVVDEEKKSVSNTFS